MEECVSSHLSAPRPRSDPSLSALPLFPLSRYASFHLIVLGLDSLEARRWMNAAAWSLLAFNPDGSPDLATVKPLIDGGTEGFKGHARVILPGHTPCFECTLWLFPPQVTYPLCTLAETPRSPAHCIEWAHLLEWGRARPGEEFDADDEAHMAWVYAAASARATANGIDGVTPALTAGVVKNIVPAIASTNAAVAAACALEAFKLVTLAAPGLDNYLLYAGGEGAYSHTASYARDEACVLCSPGVPMAARGGDSLESFLAAVSATAALADRARGGKLAGPSVSLNGTPLYAKGAFEADTAGNLGKVRGREAGEEREDAPTTTPVPRAHTLLSPTQNTHRPSPPWALPTAPS